MPENIHEDQARKYLDDSFLEFYGVGDHATTSATQEQLVNLISTVISTVEGYMY